METIDVGKINWKVVNHPEITNMEISEYGHLRRISGGYAGIIRTGTVDNNGYCSVRLKIDKKVYKKFLVHRLVMLTFSPEGNYEGATVDHIDENKTNNHFSNLQWLTIGENVAKHKRINNITVHNRRKLTDKEVKKSRDLYKKGVSIGNIWKLLNKKVTYPSVLHMLKNNSYKDVI